MNIHSGSDMEVYTVGNRQGKQNEEQINTTPEQEMEYDYYNIDTEQNDSPSEFFSLDDYTTAESRQSESEQYTGNYYTEPSNWNNSGYTAVQVSFADVKKMVHELVNGLSVLKKLGKTDEEIQKAVENEVRNYQANIIYQTQEEVEEAENYSFITCIADDIRKFKVVMQNPIVAAVIKFPITSKQISMLYDSLMQMIAKPDISETEPHYGKDEEKGQIEQLIEKVAHLENIVEHLQDEIQNILIAIKNEISPESIIQDLESFKDALKMDLIDNLNREIEYLKEKVTEIDTIYSQREDEQETIVNFINEKLTEFEEKLRENKGDIPDIVWQRLQEQLEQMRAELEYTLETKLENKIESKIQYSEPASKKEQLSQAQETEETEQESEEEGEEEEEEEDENGTETQQIPQVETKSSLMDMLKDPKKLPYIIGAGAVIGFIIARVLHIHI